MGGSGRISPRAPARPPRPPFRISRMSQAPLPGAGGVLAAELRNVLVSWCSVSNTSVQKIRTQQWGLFCPKSHSFIQLWSVGRLPLPCPPRRQEQEWAEPRVRAGLTLTDGGLKLSPSWILPSGPCPPAPGREQRTATPPRLAWGGGDPAEPPAFPPGRHCPVLSQHEFYYLSERTCYSTHTGRQQSIPGPHPT